MSELEHKETMQALTLPTMALRGITVFPSMLLHFDVGRQTSIKALDQAVELGSYLFLVPQKDLSVDDPELSDLYSIGTIAAAAALVGLVYLLVRRNKYDENHLTQTVKNAA